MPRLNRSMSGSPRGNLVVEKLSQEEVQVYFVPLKEHLARLEYADANKYMYEEVYGRKPRADGYKTQILLINCKKDCVTIFPIKTGAFDVNFMLPKYSKIRRITIADADVSSCDWEDSDSVRTVMEILEDLPSGFVKDYDFGLGVLKDYRFIVESVEELSDCEEIFISKSEPTSISEDRRIFRISAADFDSLRKELNRITTHGQTATRSAKDGQTYNTLAAKIGRLEKFVKIGRDPMRKLITQAAQGKEILNKADQTQVLNMVTRHAKSIAETEPENLVKLKNDIELVNLDQLIQRYAEMMKGKNLKEDKWQKLFSENPFVLNLVFGCPLIKVKDHASMGGRKFSGKGEVFTDYLMKHRLTGNVAVFEIKTPQTALFKGPYRGGVWTPSHDFSGAISQVLDQRYKLQNNFAQIKDNSEDYDIKSHSIRCCLIIGTVPTESSQVNSFELFRSNSKNVEIVTFDELLGKLKILQNFLSSDNNESGKDTVSVGDVDSGDEWLDDDADGDLEDEDLEEDGES